MADLPELAPLSQVLPVQRDQRTDKRKPKEKEAPKPRPPAARERPPRDDDATGTIDEYA